MAKHDIIERLETELGSVLRRYDRIRLMAGKDSLHALESAAYVVLRAIHDEGKIRAANVAGNLGLDKTTISRHIAQLERRGLIERLPDTTDRRASLLRLSAKGRRKLDAHRQLRQAALEEHLDDWSRHDKREFLRLLHKYNTAMEQRLDALTTHNSANH
jgi:DNA-binding MarR family transcriptional regulator